jgi:hypothetical protein
MAEMSGYYSVSAGHGLANVTVRVLHVHSAAAFVLDRDFKRAAGFAPFVDDFGSWVSLNSEAAKSMVRAAEATKVPVAITMAGLLIQLLNDPRWSALHNRRNQDFHRWRGQSLIGGVPPRSPWKPLADGSSVLTVRAVPEHVPLEVTELVEEAAAGLYTLADSMHHWEVGLADSLRELGVPVWKSERHSP